MRGAGQPPHRLVVVGLGQQVGAFEALQLKPVFEQPQELVGRRHVGGVIPADVAAAPQRRQCVDGGGHMQLVVVAAVHQLQELDGEFDVTQTAAAEFELAGPHAGGHQFLDAPAHRLHLGHEVLTLTRGPHHRHQRLDVALAQFGVSCGRPGLQQRLEFPRLGPAFVVGDVRVQGAHQLTLLALGPQRGIHFEERVAGKPHHLAGDPGGQGEAAVRAIVGDEDDVDVADVVQFAGPAFAHRDHGERGWWGRLRTPTGSPHSTPHPTPRRRDRTDVPPRS